MVAPFFSVIIPVYNVAPYLEECLDSVCTQTFRDWECLCVDDGSIDGCNSILEDYARKDVRFKITHQRNRGVSVARNRALDSTWLQGEYVNFVDSDDILLSERFTVAHQILQEKNVDLLRLKLLPWHEGDSVSYQPTVDGLHYINHDDVLKWGAPVLLKEGWAPSLFIRRIGALKECRFPASLVMREDNIFSLYLLLSVKTAFEGEDCGYLYRQSAKSATKKARKTGDAIRFLNEIGTLWSIYKSFPNGNKFSDLFSRTLTRDIELWLRFSGRRVSFEARKSYQMAIDRLIKQGLVLSKEVRYYTRFNVWCFRKLNLIFPTRIVWWLRRFCYRLWYT